jgi:excisionase family DNA binding protein
MSDNWLRLDEVAADLSVHYMTVYRYVRLGLIPATKVGQTWRITPEALAESCKVVGTATSDVYPTAIAPALRRLGEYWEAGEIGVFHWMCSW